MSEQRHDDQRHEGSSIMAQRQANPVLNPVVKPDTHQAEMNEVTSFITMLNAIILSAVDAVGNDGRIDGGEAMKLGMQGFQLVSAIIGAVTRKHETTARDRLKFAVENSRVHLPE